MNKTPGSAEMPSPEVLALIDTLHTTGLRLEELTDGQVDTVANSDGAPFLLRGAQDHLRLSEAAKQSAILNALPAHIALLDAQGEILTVNEAWRRFATANGLVGADGAVGINYLKVCDTAHGVSCDEALPVAAGIRAVLGGAAHSYALEYPCHSPSQQRWFQMTVTPLFENHPNGAVVMHIDITARKAAEERVAYLNRVYATLSGINSVIVRVRDRGSLFDEACRLAVGAGGFRMALITLADECTGKIVLAASAGVDEAFSNALRHYLASIESGHFGNTLLERVITQKKAMVVNDLQGNTEVAFRQQYIDAGVCSLVILPLVVEGRAVGSLVLYAHERDFFRDEELTLLTELASDVSFAMDHIEKQERIDYLAFYDVLTGLANQRLFLERLGQYARSAVTAGHGLAVFLMDMERFKNINDHLGTAAGDELLRQVAQWLIRSAGDASVFARLGADHFAAVMPVVRQSGDMVQYLESKLEAFQEHPFGLGDSVLRIGVKVGVAMLPGDGTDADTLFRHAEAALKQAKAHGDRYLFYTPQMTESVAGRLKLENQLRLALERGEFVLHYQPKVNLASGKMTSAEALIRWNDPHTGLLVPPGQFIPVLEETGLIHAVGRWALRQAVADYLRWCAAGLAVVRIAVNVSPLQLRDRGFIAEVQRAIGGDPRAPAGLELEITESLIMEDVKHSITSLHALRAMGLTVAIDDFGTGFSSLTICPGSPSTRSRSTAPLCWA